MARNPPKLVEALNDVINGEQSTGGGAESAARPRHEDVPNMRYSAPRPASEDTAGDEVPL
jgi:hypothetical protein